MLYYAVLKSALLRWKVIRYVGRLSDAFYVPLGLFTIVNVEFVYEQLLNFIQCLPVGRVFLKSRGNILADEIQMLG